jgi:DNA-binding beta-propeller fold protein YncE
VTPLTVLCALCLSAAMLTLWCASASASIAQGHVFDSSFGGQGTGEGQFEEPTGVAVDEATGAVYVVDAKDERVEIFKPDGSGGYAYVSQFKVRSPGAIAVDNSTSVSDPSRGDVYVVGSTEKEAPAEERDVVYEYSPVAERIDHKVYEFKSGEREEEFEDVSGVAVDPDGVLWVYWEEEGLIDGFAKQSTKSGGAKLVWEPSLRREPEVEGKFECSARGAFGVAPEDEMFYLGYERENAREECPGEEGETPDPFGVAKLDGEAPVPRTVAREVVRGDSTGVAVDSSTGNVYVDEGSSVAALTPGGLLIERFGAEHLDGGDGVAVDGASGEVFVAQTGADRIAVFEPDTETGAPVVDGVSSQNLSANATELRAQIDPHGIETEYWFQYGTADCSSEEASCTQVPIPAGKIEAGFGDQSASVVVNNLKPATAYRYRVLAKNTAGSVVGAPSVSTFTTLASPSVLPDGRAWELVSPAEKHGAAIEAIPPHAKDGIIQSSADGGALAWLANGPVVSEPEGNRDFEFAQLFSRRGPQGWVTTSLETPHDTGQGLVVPVPSEYHYFSPDLSQSIVEPTEPKEPAADAGGGVVENPPLSPLATEKTPYVRQDPPATPAYQPLVTAGNDTASTRFGGEVEFLDATPDLQHVLLESKVGLSAETPSAPGLYERDAGGVLRLVSVLPDGSAAPDELGREPSLGDGGGVNSRNALSSDGSWVFWTEADEEHLYLRDTQRGETIAVNAAQGDGSTEPGPGGQVVPEPEEGHQEVHFQSASSDGSKVFFTDTARLSEDSGEEPVGEEAPADLYEFELTSAPGEQLHGRLTDLTAGAPTASADVLNVIPGASQDGSNVYFVANGVLAPGATPGECVRDVHGEAPAPQPDATCNLYVSEPDPEQPGGRETEFIAALSYEDAADWGSGNFSSNERSQGNLSGVTSSTSPNGQYLAFMSRESLTGYDNRDAVSDQPDEEVYLYDASTGRLTCASCNPESQGEDGEWQRPHGVFDTAVAGEGIGLLVDRPETWLGHWLAGSIPGWASDVGGDGGGQPHALYQPRYLSDDGRLFFDSPDALVPADRNGKNDVYEYEPENVGSCQHSAGCLGLISSGTSDRESAFLDASENGDDVFFLTAAQLVPADNDREFDIYDAHVCSEASPCPAASSQTSEECDDTAACRPSSSPSALVAVTPSATYSGPGNIDTAKKGVSPSKTAVKARPLTRAQRLAKALKECKKLKKKHKRAICEAKARKHFDAKPKAKAKKANSSSTGRRGR